MEHFSLTVLLTTHRSHFGNIDEGSAEVVGVDEFSGKGDSAQEGKRVKGRPMGAPSGRDRVGEEAEGQVEDGATAARRRGRHQGRSCRDAK